MSYKNSYTTIVAFRNDNKDGTRMSNLRSCLKYYSGLCNNIVVVEQDNAKNIEKICAEYPNIQYVWAFNSGLFNKSWAYNIGILHANKLNLPQIYMFCDVDIAIPEQSIEQAITMFDDENVVAVNPYSKIWHLNREQTAKFMSNYSFDVITPDMKDSPTGSVVYAGGCVFMRDSMLKDINGWDEEYRGWGAEDNAMGTVIIRKYGTLRAMTIKDGICVHLWHTSGTGKSKMEHEMYMSNKERFHKLLEVNVNDFIESRKFVSIGNKDKYYF